MKMVEMKPMTHVDRYAHPEDCPESPLQAAQGLKLPDWYLIASRPLTECPKPKPQRTSAAKDRLRQLCKEDITYPMPNNIEWLQKMLDKEKILAMDVADDGYCLFASVYCCLRYMGVEAYVENYSELMMDTISHLRRMSVKEKFVHRYKKPKAFDRWLEAIESGSRGVSKFDALAGLVDMLSLNVILHKAEGSVSLWPKGCPPVETIAIAELESSSGTQHYIPLFPEVSSALRRELGLEGLISGLSNISLGFADERTHKKNYEPYDPCRVNILYTEDTGRLKRPNKYAPQENIADKRSTYLQERGIIAGAKMPQRFPISIQNIARWYRVIPYFANREGVSFFNAIYAGMFYAGYMPYEEPDLIRSNLVKFLELPDFQLQYTSLETEPSEKANWIKDLRTGGPSCERMELMEAAAKMLCLTIVVHAPFHDVGAVPLILQPSNAPSRCAIAIAVDWSMTDNHKFFCLLPIARGRMRTHSDLAFGASPMSSPNISPVYQSRTQWHVTPPGSPYTHTPPASRRSSMNQSPMAMRTGSPRAIVGAGTPRAILGAGSPMATRADSPRSIGTGSPRPRAGTPPVSPAAVVAKSSSPTVHKSPSRKSTMTGDFSGIEGPRFPILRKDQGYVREFFGSLRARVNARSLREVHKNTYVEIDWMDRVYFAPGIGERMMPLTVSEERMTQAVKKIKDAAVDPYNVSSAIAAARKRDNVHPVRVSNGLFSLFESVYIGMYYLGEIDEGVEPQRIRDDLVQFLTTPEVKKQYCKTSEKWYAEWINGIKKNDKETVVAPVIQAIAQMYRITVVWYTLATPDGDVVFHPKNCTSYCTIAIANDKSDHRFMAMCAYPDKARKVEAPGAAPPSPEQSPASSPAKATDTEIPMLTLKRPNTLQPSASRGLLSSITGSNPNSFLSRPGVQPNFPNQYAKDKPIPINTWARQTVEARTVKVAQEHYIAVHDNRPPLEPTPGTVGRVEELRDTLKGDTIFPHKNNTADFNATVHELTARQIQNPAGAHVQLALSTIMDFYDVCVLEVDGAGWCSFNAIFGSLWHAGWRIFENGFEMYQSFYEYVVANVERLSLTYDVMWADNAITDMIDMMARGHTEAARMLQFMIMADWLQINLMVFSDEWCHNKCYFPDGVNRLEIPTVAIFNVGNGHFQSLIPIGQVNPPDRNNIDEALRTLPSVGANSNAPPKPPRRQQQPNFDNPPSPRKDLAVMKELDRMRTHVQRIFGGGRQRGDEFVWETMFQARGPHLQKNLDVLMAIMGMSAQEILDSMEAQERDVYNQLRQTDIFVPLFARNKPWINDVVKYQILKYVASEYECDFTYHVHYMCNMFAVEETEMTYLLETEKKSRRQK